jgi:hypothetical protein
LYPDLLQTLQLNLRPFDEGCRDRNAPIPLCAKSSEESSCVSGWLLIRSRAVFVFYGRPLLWRSCHHFPCPSDLDTGTRHIRKLQARRNPGSQDLILSTRVQVLLARSPVHNIEYACTQYPQANSSALTRFTSHRICARRTPTERKGGIYFKYHIY